MDIPLVLMDDIDGFIGSCMSVQVKRVPVVNDAVSKKAVGTLGGFAQFDDLFEFIDGEAVVQQDAVVMFYAPSVGSDKSVCKAGNMRLIYPAGLPDAIMTVCPLDLSSLRAFLFEGRIPSWSASVPSMSKNNILLDITCYLHSDCRYYTIYEGKCATYQAILTCWLFCVYSGAGSDIMKDVEMKR